MHVVGEVVVQKFGAEALASTEALLRGAHIVASTHASGRTPCVVLPAVDERGDLLAIAESFAGELSAQRRDALLGSDSALAAALFALCLEHAGVDARVFTGSDAAAIGSALSERAVAVVVSSHVMDAKLGAGYADLTAVSLGTALGARVVELYTDEDGIYEDDSNQAQPAQRLDYDALLQLLADGAQPSLQQQAVEHAKRNKVALRVAPFRESAHSTLVKNPSIAPAPARASKAPPAPRSASVAPPANANANASSTAVFEERESNVRGYCRSFPTVFARAKGALQWDEAGRRYIDFFSGAGALNYGHNPDAIKRRMIDYLEQDGVSHALDMYTQAKRTFLETFRDVILAPRNLDYKVQFCGPTGANSVEAALKLARLATGRTNVASFTGGWHGMTAACLSVCGNRENRESAGAPLPFTTVLPYPEGPYKLQDALRYVEWLFEDPNSGLDTPAALILETLQSEGGIYHASPEWLRGIRALCDRYGVLLIADDIQVGCGRTGTFFSFERAGITPDMVCLSKSIGGYGQPMSLLLMRPDLDVWQPGQHTGTFRGNQLAFVASAAALENWRDPSFTEGIGERSQVVESYLRTRIAGLSNDIEIRGIGLMWGIDVTRAGGPELAKQISSKCFQNGLIIERCGRNDTVLKLMPPLNIDRAHLAEGLNILSQATVDSLRERGALPSRPGRGRSVA